MNNEENLEESREEYCDLFNDNENPPENLDEILFDDNGMTKGVTTEGGTDIERHVLANDLVFVQDETLLHDKIDLRDYSNQKIDITEGSPYVRVILLNNKLTFTS